jgi:hypothetical protein
MRPYTAQRGGALIPLQNSFFPNTTTGWELLSSVNVVSVSSTASTYLQYPYAGTVDSPHDPINDINWYNMEDGDFVYWDLARWTNANLYNKYWSNFINEISDPASKVVTCDVLLQPTDLFELDFRKIYVIDGHWLRLQKILDYDPIGDGLTKCEFLKLKSPTRFRRQSIIVDSYGIVNNNFVTTVDTTRPVVITDVQVAPSRKRPDFGFNNGTPAVSVSNNSTVRTNGNSNYVAPGASNVSITGNENSVGNGAINVNISGGDGNFISGGSSNVNMIGTSKKYVNESDVTYINGVRYKNGVAISRANVIDGGSDTVVVRQSESTTSNVIDGSEDVVISSGSNNYENVVDSGIDTILPDVPELGVGTLVNPNPRTNLTGGYDITTNTKMVDIVRDRAFTS